MLISEDKKVIFFHIPKTGGTTIQKHLKDNLKDSEEFWGIDWKNGDLSHMEYIRFLNKNYMSKEKINEFYKVAFVRNPYDRVYSGFLQTLKHGHAKNMSFEQFIDFLDKNPAKLFDYFYIHIIPMHFFVTDGKGDIMMDYIGKYENFDEDRCKLYDRLEISRKDALRNNNYKNPTEDKYLRYMDKYTGKMIDTVNRLYKKDFELFRYNTL